MNSSEVSIDRACARVVPVIEVFFSYVWKEWSYGGKTVFLLRELHEQKGEMKRKIMDKTWRV